MTKLQMFWSKVRELQAGFAGNVHVVSVEDPRRGQVGGCVSTAEPETAARSIVLGSHRLATPNEIERYETEQAELRVQLFDAELRRQGKARVFVPTK